MRRLKKMNHTLFHNWFLIQAILATTFGDYVEAGKNNRIRLNFAETILDLNPILPPSTWSCLLIVVPYTEVTDFRAIDSPYLNVEPEIFSVNPEWSYTINSTRNILAMSRSVRFVMIILLLNIRPLLRMHVGPYDIKKAYGDWNWSPYNGKTLKYYEPNPVPHIKLYPQTVVFVRPHSENFTATKFREYGGILEEFLSPAMPIIYVLTYRNPLEQKAEVERFYDVFLICTFCVDDPLRYAKVNGKRVKIYRYSKFTCLGGLNCWEVMEKGLEKAAAGGKNMYWLHEQWGQETLSILAEDTDPEQRLERGTRGELYYKILMSLFPVLNYTHGRHRRILSYKLNGPHNLVFMTEYAPIQESDIVFVTSVGVAESAESTLPVFLDNFESSIWTLTGIFVLASASIFALIGICAARGHFMRHIFIFSQYLVQSTAYLAFLHIDQVPSDSLIISKLKKTQLAINSLLVPWMFAVLILSNLYKGVMKSNFAFFFPYKTELNNWRDFENFSVYGFLPDDSCDESMYRNFESHDEWLFGFSERYIQWELNDRPHPEPSSSARTPIYHQYFNSRLNRPFIRQKDGVLAWLDNAISKAKACTISLGESGSDNSTRITNSEPKIEYETNRCHAEAHRLESFFERLDYICPGEFETYLGTKYQKLVADYKKYRQLNITRWDITYHAYHSLGSCRVPQKSSYEEMYWMTRKSRSAFIFHRSDFPWYWNLFKKAMKADASLKFAHTGSQELNKLRKGDGIGGGNGYEASFSLTGPTFSYIAQSEWILKRAKTLTSSGILGYYEKWFRILNKPRNESASEEVQESTTGAVSISIENDWIVSSFATLAFGSGLAFLAIVAEVTVYRLKSLKRICGLVSRVKQFEYEP